MEGSWEGRVDDGRGETSEESLGSRKVTAFELDMGKWIAFQQVNWVTFKWNKDGRAKTLRRENTEYIFGEKQHLHSLEFWDVRMETEAG